MTNQVETEQRLSRRRLLGRVLRVGGSTVALVATGDSVYQASRFRQAATRIHDSYSDGDVDSRYRAYDKAEDALNKTERDLKVIFVSIIAAAAGRLTRPKSDKPTTI